jgi:hypothetical protein
MSLRSKSSAKNARVEPARTPPAALAAEREWRAATAAVQRAWRSWSEATGDERRPAFDRYDRALAREERAAAVLERVLGG